MENIQIISNLTGNVYIDGIQVGKIEKGDIREYLRFVGDHRIQIESEDRMFSKNVTIEKGETVKLTIPQESKDLPAS